MKRTVPVPVLPIVSVTATNAARVPENSPRRLVPPPFLRSELGELDELFPLQEAEEMTDSGLRGLGRLPELAANRGRDLPGIAMPVDLAPAEGSQIVEAEPFRRQKIGEPVDDGPRAGRTGPRPDENDPAVLFFPAAGAPRREVEKVQIAGAGNAIPSSSRGDPRGASSGAGATRKNTPGRDRSPARGHSEARC